MYAVWRGATAAAQWCDGELRRRSVGVDLASPIAPESGVNFQYQAESYLFNN
jgi:hypothetical protein